MEDSFSLLLSCMFLCTVCVGICGVVSKLCRPVYRHFHPSITSTSPAIMSPCTDTYLLMKSKVISASAVSGMFKKLWACLVRILTFSTHFNISRIDPSRTLWLPKQLLIVIFSCFSTKQDWCKSKATTDTCDVVLLLCASKARYVLLS